MPDLFVFAYSQLPGGGLSPVLLPPTAGDGLVGTFNGTSFEYSLDIPVSIAHGGTNATSMPHTNGINFFDGSSLSTTAAGTNGQILVGSTGSPSSFVTPTAGNGLSGTFNGTTHEYALSAPVSIANGGTNATSMAHTNGVAYYDGTRISTLVKGTGGQVLIGSANQPTFITPTAGTGLVGTFASNSLDYALSVPVSIANGGTNATSMSNSNGAVVYDGTRLVSVAPGTAGQLLTSNGAGSAPSFQTATASVGNSIISTGSPPFTLASILSAVYVGPMGLAVTTSATNAQFLVPCSGVISNLYVWITGNLSTNAVTVRLNVNGSNTSLLVTIPASTTGVFSAATPTVSISAGDRIQWQISQALVGIITGTISCQFRS